MMSLPMPDNAGYFFLAAGQVWSGRRFKGRVTSEEVLGVLGFWGFLKRQGVFVDGRSDGCAGASGSAGSAAGSCFGPEFWRRELGLMSAFLRLGFG